MNTFIIKRNCGSDTIFDRVCHSPPSLEDVNLILSVLRKYEYKSLGYSIEIIRGNNHRKVTGLFRSVEDFFDYFENLCMEGITYGVVMYINR